MQSGIVKLFNFRSIYAKKSPGNRKSKKESVDEDTDGEKKVAKRQRERDREIERERERERRNGKIEKGRWHEPEKEKVILQQEAKL